MEKEKVILIGSNNKNTLGKARSFGEAGYMPIVIWVGPRYNLVRYCKYVKESYEVQTAEQGINLILKTFASPSKKTLLSAEGDAIVAALDAHYNQLNEFFYFYNGGAEGRLLYYLEKENLCKAAEACGFRVPKSEAVKVGELPRLVKYPIFTKAADSFDLGWKSSAHICYNEDDLISVYSHLKCDTILIQEYIPKKNEFMLQGISFHGGEEVYLPIQGSFYRLPNGEYGSYGYFEEYKSGPELFNQLKKLLSQIKYSGIFEVEFIIAEDGTLYFLEINFRDTMWNHAFTNMGVNLNAIWAKSEIKGKLCIGESKISKSPSRFMNENIDFDRYVKTGKISLQKWIKDFYSCDTHMLWCKDDQRPFRKYLILILLRRLEKIGIIKGNYVS